MWVSVFQAGAQQAQRSKVWRRWRVYETGRGLARMEHRLEKGVGRWEVRLDNGNRYQIMKILNDLLCHLYCQLVNQHAFSLFHVVQKERIVTINAYIAPNTVSSALNKLSCLIFTANRKASTTIIPSFRWENGGTAWLSKLPEILPLNTSP